MKQKRLIIVSMFLIALIFLVIAINQFFYVQNAHSTFDNYYAFRGCNQLVEKTDNYAYCKIPSGETIKIVKFNSWWYLDGDLPSCLLNICF